ncbi:unnamed protein product, partial [Tetraodon nigroviridis]
LLGPLLCGHQPLQKPANLLGQHYRDVPRQEKARNPSPHLRHLRVGLQMHAAGPRGPVHSVHRRVWSWQDGEHEEGDSVPGTRGLIPQREEGAQPACKHASPP